MIHKSAQHTVSAKEPTATTTTFISIIPTRRLDLFIQLRKQRLCQNWVHI